LGDTVRPSSDLSKEELATYNTVIAELRKDEKFEKVYQALQKSEDIFVLTTLSMEGASGFFSWEVNELPSPISHSDLAAHLRNGGTYENLPRRFEHVIAVEDIAGKNASSTTAEEFFHAYQYEFYGVADFECKGETTAIELEAKLFKASLLDGMGVKDVRHLNAPTTILFEAYENQRHWFWSNWSETPLELYPKLHPNINTYGYPSEAIPDKDEQNDHEAFDSISN